MNDGFEADFYKTLEMVVTRTRTIVLTLTLALQVSACADSGESESDEAKAFRIKEEANELVKQERYREALAKYEESMALNPDYIANYYNIGNVYGYLGNKKAMLDNYNKAIELGYTYPRLYYNMAWFLYRMGEYEESIEVYEALNEALPNAADVKLNLALAYRDIGRHDDARAILEEGLKLDPTNRKMLLQLDNIKSSGHWRDSPPDPTYSREQCRQEKTHCEEAGYIALKDGQTEAAYSFFKTACGEGERMSCAEAGMIDYKRQDKQAAESLFRQGCRLEDMTSCANLADLYWHRNDKETALKHYQQACNYGHSRACGVLGDYLLKSSPTEAKHWYDTSCKLGNKEGCQRAARL